MLASLHAITVSRGPKLREKCLNLCLYLIQLTSHPPTPFLFQPSLFIPLFPLASSFSFDARQRENLTEPAGRSSQVWKLFAAAHCPPSFASLCARARNPLLGVFIIIRYRAPRPETIKRAKTLCSFDSALAKLLGTFSLLFGVCGLWTLIEHLVPAASALWNRSSFEAEFDPLAGIKWNWDFNRTERIFRWDASASKNFFLQLQTG